MESMYKIIWPDVREVSATWLIQAASDDVANGLADYPTPKTVADAIVILRETGSVTLAESI